MLSSMDPRPGDITISVFNAARQTHPRPVHPGRPWLFAAFMAAGATVAALAGVLLGILAATEAGIGGTHWSEVVQAHGRIQLFGFAAPFVVALALEFMPRLNQQPAVAARVRLAIPALLLAGALTMAAAQVWESTLAWLAWPGAASYAAAAMWFAALAVRFPSPRPFAIDPQPLYFKAASLWLAATALLVIWAFGASEDAVFPLDLSAAIAETFLRGFVMLLIAGVALRAFPGHLGLSPMPARAQAICFAAFNAALLGWLASAGLGELDDFEPGLRLADTVLAVSLLGFTTALGVFGNLRTRFGGPRYGLLIPVAWAGAVVYSAMLAAAAVGWPDLSLYQDGAIRHTFMLAFMAPLMVAMAHVVLARFGTGRIPWENALTAGFVLLVAAWPLRVVPALFGDAPSNAEQAIISASGGLAMAGLALTAAVCFRTAAQIRAAHR